jgi:hypothetical protein
MGGSWNGGYAIVIEGAMVRDPWQHRHGTSTLLPNKAVHRTLVHVAHFRDCRHVFRVAGSVLGSVERRYIWPLARIHHAPLDTCIRSS